MISKLIILLVVLGCCSAYWGAYRISLSSDRNAAHIVSHNGRRVDLSKTSFDKFTGLNGWEITLSGPDEFTTTIQSTDEIGYELLFNILTQHRGVLDDVSFQNILHTIQHYVQRGVLDERVLEFFRKLSYSHYSNWRNNYLYKRNDCNSCCETKCQKTLLFGIRSHQSCIENCISDSTNECNCFQPIRIEDRTHDLNALNFGGHLEEAHHHTRHHNQQNEHHCISCCNQRCHHKKIYGILSGNLEDCLEECLTDKVNDHCGCSWHHSMDTSRHHRSHKSRCLDCCEKKCETLKIFGLGNHQDCLQSCLTGTSTDCNCEHKPRCVNCCLSRCQRGDVFWRHDENCLSKCLNDEDSFCDCSHHHWKEQEQHPVEWQERKFQIYGVTDNSKRCEHCCQQLCQNAWKEGLNKNLCVNLCKANAIGSCSCARNFW